jgi:hypothetical protein
MMKTLDTCSNPGNDICYTDKRGNYMNQKDAHEKDMNQNGIISDGIIENDMNQKKDMKAIHMKQYI